MKRTTSVLAASALALAGAVASAPTASAATGGGIVFNRSTSTGNVRVSPSRPFSSSNSVLVYPGSDSYKAGVGNVQCFYPLKRAVSQYGGVYNAYEIRCMGSDNVALYLQVG
jgi:hypothetical protein